MPRDKMAAVRLAVQFGRQHASLAMTVVEIATDATKLAELAWKARYALERQRCPGRFISQARPIAERYGAQLVDRRDVEGCVVGLKFRSGLYSSGFRNIFFVS